MADDPIKQRLDSIYNLLNGKIVKLDEKESITAGNASSTLKAILDALKRLAADNDTAKIVNALQKTERAILDADGNFKKLSNLANIDEKKLIESFGVSEKAAKDNKEAAKDIKEAAKDIKEVTKKVQQQNQEADKQQKVQKQVTKEFENYLKELKKRPDYKEINKGGAITNAYTRSGGDFDKFKKSVEDRINRLARKDQSSQSELQKIKTAEIHTKSNKQNKEAVQEENKGNATNVINEAVAGKTPDNETVVKTNKEREKALQNLEDYNKIFGNIGSEEITLRQRILENTELYAGYLSGLVEANGKLVDAVNAQVFYGRQFATVLAKAVRGVGRINLPRSLGNLDIAANQLTEKLKQTKVQPRVKQAPEDSEYGSGKQALEEEVRLKSGKPRGSFKDQENKNQRRQEQKSFIALLIPALAKLLKKSSIWDAIKLLLLKFGKNHPLLAAGALMAGPALMAGGIGLRAMGGLKGVLPRIAGSEAAATLTGAGKYISRYSKPIISSVKGGVSNVAGKVGNAIKTHLWDNPWAYVTNKKKADMWHDYAEYLKGSEAEWRKQYIAFADPYSAREMREAIKQNRFIKARANFARHELAWKSASPIRNVQATSLKAYRNVGRAMTNASRWAGAGVETLINAKWGPTVNSLLKSLKAGFTNAGQFIASWSNTITHSIIPNGFKKIQSSFKLGSRKFFNALGNKATWEAGFKGAGTIFKGAGKIFKNFMNPTKLLKSIPTGIKGMNVGTMWAKGLGKIGGIGKAIKGVPGLGALFEVIGDIPALLQAKKQGGSAFGKQISKTGGAAIGSVVGGILGTALGPLGTVIGSMIGAWVGRVIGQGFGGALAKIGENLKGWVEPFKKIFKGLGSVFGFLGRILKIVIAPLRILGVLAGKILGKYIEAWTGIVKNILEFVAPMFETIGKAFEAMSAKLDEFFEKHPKLAEWTGWSSGKDKGNSSGKDNGNSSGTAKQGQTNFDKLVQEERGKMKKEGTDKNLKDPDKAATLNAIQRLNKHTTNGIANTVDMRDLGLYGNVAATNSRPYIPVNNALRMKMLDDKFKEWGVAVDYTSNMGGHDSNKTGGHYVGNKVDVVTKDKYGRARQLSKEQENWLRANGYIGNGAVGWHNAGSGYHYDLRVASGARTNVAGASTATGTATSTAVHQQTDDGVREALLAFTAANKKDKEGKRTRDLIFQATDVTGSLGCWGITQVNNSGQMRH